MLRVGVLLTAVFALMFVSGVASATTLLPVSNGGFEDGDFSYWTLGADGTPTDFTFVGGAFPSAGPDCAHTGHYGACLGSTDGVPNASGSYDDVDILSQTIAGLTPGTRYTLTFWLENDASYPNEFALVWDGVTKFSEVDSDPFGWTEFSETKVVTGTTSTIQFLSYNEPGYWGLDDINTSNGIAPEPASFALIGLGLVGLGVLRRRARG